jgi:predicted CoA-substrate-specific enzyme activase
VAVTNNFLGLDAGSACLAAAVVGTAGEMLALAYEFHHGDVAETLTRILSRLGPGPYQVAATSSTPALVRADRHYDNQISLMTAARWLHGRLGSILVVGAEKFGLIRFDRDGRYRGYKTNTSCAAGTGSFLEQQARRLNLSGVAELSSLALANQGDLPQIASRCSVFAKTDLVHAQQEGYSLAQICDGLCHGLARNIADTLFTGEPLLPPILFTGGVSLNQAVIKHIADIIGREPIVDAHTAHGALGAAWQMLEEAKSTPLGPPRLPTDIVDHRRPERKYYYQPLDPNRSQAPSFGGRFSYLTTGASSADPVEVDVYEIPSSGAINQVYLGLDIGSTSTKAVLLSKNRVVLAGFYTRTAGRPVAAVQRLTSAIADVSLRTGGRFEVLGAGTTGAGRKLVGKVVRADEVVDEITAHARAAFEINPEVDTIIEIGGQDSKFTTMVGGIVTFSAMNNVCAAGTGSFIEELAQRLGCPLTEFEDRVKGRGAPMASDRCTVFMERDVNYYLKEGYAVDELLAAVLHSICENYLTKVAVAGSIGQQVTFQGATAKNKALVAVFEQRLKRPILVSKYCHLTGALGTALLLSDQKHHQSAFRSLDIHQKQIPVRSEVCELCTNHCKLTVADLDGEPVAYGFLCGRDYNTRKKVSNNQSGFDLQAARQQAFFSEDAAAVHPGPSIGLPSALHMVEDLSVWQKFFHELGFKTITPGDQNAAVKRGKQTAGAEFCAPITALYGHVALLLEKADYLFLPIYLEQKDDQGQARRQYCYYTQYAVPLVSDLDHGGRILKPLVHYLYGSLHTKVELYRSLRALAPDRIDFFKVAAAYDRAMEFKESARRRLQAAFTSETRNPGDIQVVLLGRPYTILQKGMNKGIPDIFAAFGIKAFFQDMLPDQPPRDGPLTPLLGVLHWHFAARLLEAAEMVAGMPGLYPVLVTSFSCTPDAFIVESCKKVLAAHGKPYLVLQVDEHDSSLGYETRIEAAIRSFRNHFHAQGPARPAIYHPSLKPRRVTDLAGKTLFLPNWDHYTMSLVAAGLRRAGVDARLLARSETGLQKGLRHNTGQCIPLNSIAQDYIDNILGQGLDPANCALWIGAANIACNLGLFPHLIQVVLDEQGQGLEKAGVYVGAFTFAELSIRLPVTVYFAYMFGGLLRSMGCRTRPYELTPGTTDQVLSTSLEVLKSAFENGRARDEALAEIVAAFQAIEAAPRGRPKVAIFGDLYVRDNESMNRNLIGFIEDHGGEVITTPYNEYLKMISGPYLRKWFVEGDYLNVLSVEALLMTLKWLEKDYYRHVEKVLGRIDRKNEVAPRKILAEYGVRLEHTGESMENLLKIFHLMREYPDLSLFVQTSPAFCCPSLVTEAMAQTIERRTGVPVVSITYDGTGGSRNDAVIPYLKYPRINPRRH